MLFGKFDQALSGDYVHVMSLSQNEICVNKKYAGNANWHDPDEIGTQGSRASVCQRDVGSHSLPGYGVLSLSKDNLCESR